MIIKKYIKLLDGYGACKEAIDWSKQFKTSQECWDNCERGDWMVWLLALLVDKRGSKSHKKLVLTTCKCVRLVWEYMPSVSQKCIVQLEKWAEGDDSIDLEKVYKNAHATSICTTIYAAAATYAAAYAAAATTYAAYAAATTYATYAATTTYATADAAAYAATTATAYAAATTYATTATAYAAAANAASQIKALKQCADYVRADYPVLKLKKGGGEWVLIKMFSPIRWKNHK